jgi:iron complex outermembrane receptor protein/hemoglobin/transferrin/lactoferrin receptor protein
VTLRGDVSPWVEDLDLRLSLQRYSEALRRTRPSVEQRWHNEVTTEGLAVSARTRPQRFGDAALSFAYGADGYADVVRSRADQRFTDIDVAFDLSRGSYLDGSRYLTGGLFGQLVLDVTRFVELRGGARGAWVKASAPADPQSASRAIDADYAAAVAQAGVTLHAAEGVDVALNYDQGFRAPNLDDLTARQQVGPGFQFENDALRPERAHTLELGMHARHDVLSLDLWTFATFIEGAILRAPRTAQDCPAQTPACATSRELYQLVNAQTTSRIFGAEGGITLFLPQDITLRNVTSYAFGDGPRVPDGSAQGRGPLSRVPPLHGSLELRHRHLASGVYTTFALRWALRQDRLSVTDLGDARIPPGGTPGYAVLDLRAGYRMREHLVLSLSLDNLLDAPYRVHGSSINGPARGISAGVSMGY